MSCVQRAKIHHKGSHHPLVYTSHVKISVFCCTEHRRLSACAHVLKISCNTQTWRVCVHTITALTTLGWNNLPAYLSRPRTWLPLEGRGIWVLLTSVSLAPAMAAHSLHVHWRDQVESHEEMLKASRKSHYNLQTSWRDHCDRKKSPLSPSIHNSCHINHFLHWDVQSPNKQFPTV